MGSKGGKNTVSVGAWMWTMFVLAIPCVGFVMMLVWAFTGKSDTSRNYFRALIAWFVVFLALRLVLLATGVTAMMDKRVESWLRSYFATESKTAQKPATSPPHGPAPAHQSSD